MSLARILYATEIGQSVNAVRNGISSVASLMQDLWRMARLLKRLVAQIVERLVPSFKVQVYRSRAVAELFYVSATFIVTRQDVKQNDSPAITLHQGSAGLKLIVAGMETVGIARNWFETRPGSGRAFTVVNTHASIPLPISHESGLRPAESRIFEREVLLDLGSRIACRIEPEVEEVESVSAFRSLHNKRHYQAKIRTSRKLRLCSTACG